MELWETLFAGCRKAAFAFPQAVNGVFHSSIASYAHFHDVCLIFVIYTKRILYLFGWTHIIMLIELNERVNEMLEYISAPEAAKKWGISERRVQKLCEENRIPGVVKFSRLWLIPKDAEKPADKRKRGKIESKNSTI
jgi:hypothetical protein